MQTSSTFELVCLGSDPWSLSWFTGGLKLLAMKGDLIAVMFGQMTILEFNGNSFSRRKAVVSIGKWVSGVNILMRGALANRSSSKIMRINSQKFYCCEGHSYVLKWYRRFLQKSSPFLDTWQRIWSRTKDEERSGHWVEEYLSSQIDSVKWAQC